MKNGTSDDKPTPLTLPDPQPLPPEIIKTRSHNDGVVVSLADLDELRGKIAQARSAKKLQLILDAPVPGAVVQRMPAQELMLTLKDIGKADCAEIVELATPEQMSVCLDLDCWSKDEVKLDEIHSWLEYLTAGEFLAAERILQALDVEMLVFYIRQMMQIHYLVDEDWPNDTAGDIVEMPDRVYIVHIPFTHEDPRSALAHGLLQLLMQYGFEFYQRLFEWVRWGQDSDLTEIAYQFRKARLEDEGFIDYYEAIAIYQPLPAKSTAPQRIPIPPSDEIMPIIAPPPTDSLFHKAVQQVDNEVFSKRLEQELMYLTNKVLCADQIDPGHAQAVRKTTRSVLRTLDLGLESLVGHDVEAASQQLLAHTLEWLFRTGFTAMATLRKQARRMTKRDPRFGLLDDMPYSLLPATWQHVIEATRQHKPRYHTALDDNPGSNTRPYRQVSDLTRTQELLDTIALLPTLFFDEFAFDFDALKEWSQQREGSHQKVEDIHFSHLFLTALAELSIHGTFTPTPLSAEEIQMYLNKIFQPRETAPHALDPEYQAMVEAELLKRPGTSAETNAHLQRFLQQIWDALIDEAAHLPFPLETPPDTRFLNLFLID